MRQIKYVEALNEALREEMIRDPDLVLIGEDIGKAWQGAFKVTKGLQEEFGSERVRDTPISEAAIVGCAVGASLTGLRVVAEIMFGDLLSLAMDQIYNQAAKIHYMFGGQASVPIVVRTNFGAAGNYGAHHSQSLEAWFAHVPGLIVIQPSTPYDAKGLLKSAIRDPNPVMFFEHKFLYNTSGEVPEAEYLVPIGEADVKREGNDVTIIATSLMVLKALRASEDLAKEGISVEVLDPRTIRPLDRKAIGNSVKKTGRVVIVHEACATGGVSGEITKVIIEEAFDYLDAPPVTVAGADTPIPVEPRMEQFVVPNEARIIEAVKKII
ncbi:MAG TPA: alpha-ketoacid dehydrogenase subunit beta [Candidatus Deferrimicrobium sp.]|nr:alpha-ketoacid dehydrogenase subunit beta [Candidatus Deferrimicrobium sp.]